MKTSTIKQQNRTIVTYYWAMYQKRSTLKKIIDGKLKKLPLYPNVNVDTLEMIKVQLVQKHGTDSGISKADMEIIEGVYKNMGDWRFHVKAAYYKLKNKLNKLYYVIRNKHKQDLRPN